MISKLKHEAELTQDTLKNVKESKGIEYERIKEELRSVVSLKTSLTTEQELASSDEFNDTIKTLNHFLEDPLHNTLKRVFKLKRLREDSVSVDSRTLMAENQESEHLENR